jgi:hypothetical protein
MREFDLSPTAYCNAYRQELISAALTIVRGYLTSGAGRARGTIGSFETWDRFARQPVAWIARDILPEKFADPVEKIVTADAGNPEQDELRMLLDSLACEFPDQWITAKDISALVKSREIGHFLNESQQNVVEAFRELAPRSVTPKSVGRILSNRKERIVGDLMLQEKTDRNENIKKWKVEKVL